MKKPKVDVREKKRGSGVWYVHINHNGARRARKVGAYERALDIADVVRAKLLLEGHEPIKKSASKLRPLKSYEPSRFCGPGVYFIQQGTDGPIKIGFTGGRLMERVRSLQTGSAKKLRVVSFMRGNECLERELHCQFDGHRLEGEWFKPEPIAKFLKQ